MPPNGARNGKGDGKKNEKAYDKALVDSVSAEL